MSQKNDTIQAKLKILHVDENLERSEKIGEMLREYGYSPEITGVDNFFLFRKELSKQYDLICTKFKHEKFTAYDILLEVRKKIPVIVFINEEQEEELSQLFQWGARWFILNDQIFGLGAIVEIVLTQQQEQREAQHIRRFLEKLIDEEKNKQTIEQRLRDEEREIAKEVEQIRRFLGKQHGD